MKILTRSETYSLEDVRVFVNATDASFRYSQKYIADKYRRLRVRLRHV